MEDRSCKNCNLLKRKDKTKCYGCEYVGCNKCVIFSCSDCCVSLCIHCKNSDDINCGCYGECVICERSVNRGENGWPCDICNKWFCSKCKYTDKNKCRQCNK
jgi:hypothetical protein